ncbi:hypothetical protein CNY89_04430 [Amaricoccus sp. HAR-UPW-R2A-40]|nr:hypothetical protein CNY89_04430 [Amaricoccus sp. HAR-UPW-R2A-40]
MNAVKTQAIADVRLGTRQSAEDLVIAGLVTLPFAGCLMILINTGMNAPGPVGSGIALVALIAGTIWNAGWRARDE